jgi:CMP/dCMP kinase
MASPSSASMIAIDGPAASGKSTLAERLARSLGYLYFDTGVMYRAATLEALRRGVRIHDEEAVTRIAEILQLDVRPPSVPDGRQYDVLSDGQDVTWQIRTPQVNEHVSPVSAYPGVRRALTALQREIGLRGRVVMVGRDIGTVVLPEADLKIYLDASVEERARRRYQECLDRGDPVDYQAILASLRSRDDYDSSRAHAPLSIAADAVVIDSTNLSIEQVVDHALELARQVKRG